MRPKNLMENVNILSLYCSHFRSSMKVTVISFNFWRDRPHRRTTRVEEMLTQTSCVFIVRRFIASQPLRVSEPRWLGDEHYQTIPIFAAGSFITEDG
jgi:hypothetical protein